MDRMKDDLAQKSGEVMDQAREQTEHAVEKMRGSAFEMMDQQKHRAADSIGSVAQALRQTSDSLKDQGPIGQYAGRAADAVEQFSSQLHDKTVEELLMDAKRFARREPELFLGGAVLLGLLASRFMKASGRRPQMRNQDFDQYGYSGNYGRSYGQSEYGRSSLGPGGNDRGAWSGEGIDYRSAGTGGYRTTLSSGTSTGSYGEMNTGATSGDVSFGQERTSFGRRQGQSGSFGAANDGTETDRKAWSSDEDETPGFGAGSSQA